MPGVGVEFSAATTLSGPLWGNSDTKVKRAIGNTTQDLVERGEAMVKRQLYPGHGLITGTLRRSVTGEMKGPLSGIIFTNIVYGPFIEGISTRQGRFKGYSMFRRTAQALDKMVNPLFKKHFKRARLG